MKTTKISTLLMLGLALSAVAVFGQQVVFTSIGQNGKLTFSTAYTISFHENL
jgi:hypothetical protein